MNTAETYKTIQHIAPTFEHFVRQTAAQAHNEAEFEHQVNNEIERIAKRLGVDLLFGEQYTLATGRADAVYNRFVIEYEPPGSLRPNLGHKHTAHAVQQVKDYIEGLAKAERHDRDRLLGVAFDGGYFIFVRYHQGHWVVEEPLEVTPASCERFLRSLFSLTSGRALIPENLVEDFGSQNVLSQQVTRALYDALAGHKDAPSAGSGETLTARLFAQWKLFFGETAGADAAAGELKHKKELRAFARGMGLKGQQVDMPRFLFALHTYFSFLVKNIARLVLQAYAGGGLGTTPLTTIANLQGEALRRELRNLESGGIFRALGIKNLLEGDFFSWYLDAWNADVEDALRRVLARLADYNPVTVQDDPYSARDLLKKLYHYLLPREIRHDLGEFYTPDWLAERLLTQLGEPLFQMPRPGARVPMPNKRLLDPACGSGTFLVLAARALKANCVQAGLAEADTLEIILNNLAGIDLNPLAVMAARVNFLLTVADLLPYRRREVEIPVYLADSILTPARGEGLFAQNRRILETAVGPLPVPEAVDSRAEMERLTDLLEEYVTGDFETEAFLTRCQREIPDLARAEHADAVLTELYEKLRDLHRRGLDGIWARVLKNAFMPLFLEPFDYVVGNPPWINWESLPQAYRDLVAPLWKDYALFQHKGFDAILGKAKDDLSALMTYVAADRYLKEGGKLAFVITQSVWKTAGGGQGFRRFRLGERGSFLKVEHVDDLSTLQVFEGASTRTSVFVLRKGVPTRYPLPYTYWKKTSKGKGLDYDSTLAEVLAQTRQMHFQAAPVDAGDPTSAWLTARPKVLDAVRKVLGPSNYRAYEGANCGGANAVYWLEILAERPDGLAVARNVTEGAKRQVEAVTVELEPDLLYPLLRGRDVGRWLARPSLHILMVQDPKSRRGIDEQVV
ncbi:MAG: N-6 DNA methylase [Anaerolineales bacterium]